MLAEGVSEGARLVPMGFNSSRHIIILNRTYLQNPARSGGGRERQIEIRYTDGELDWMYCWHQDRVMKYQAQNRGFVLAAGQTCTNVVDFNGKELTENMNDEFEGRVVNGSLGARPTRERLSVEEKRRRLQILCDDFGF